MSPNRAIWMIATVALLLRLLNCARLPSSDASLSNLPDQVEYLECGRNILHGNGLSFVDPRFDQRVYAYRMPGYPLLMAACGGDIRAVRFGQCLIDASTTIAVFLLARRWLAMRWALIAAAVVAVNPFQIYFSGLLLSETLFIVLLIWGITLLPHLVLGERAGERVLDLTPPDSETKTGGPSPQPSPRVQGEGGRFLALLFLCASTLVRPSATVLPIVLAACTPNRRWRTIAFAVIIEAALLFAWAYRNHTVVGEWIITTTNSGISAYDGLHPGATGASDQRFITNMPELRSMNESQRNRYLADRANDFVRQHPREVLRLAVIKLARLWSPIPLSAEYGSDLKLIAISLLFSMPLDVLAIVGLFSRRLPRSAKRILLAAALYFSLVHSVGVGSLRYRIPADVPMIVLATAGLAAVLERRKLYGQSPANA